MSYNEFKEKINQLNAQADILISKIEKWKSPPTLLKETSKKLKILKYPFEIMDKVKRKI